MKNIITVFFLTFLLVFNVRGAKTRYVKIGGDDTKNGNNWTNAYATVGKALLESSSGDEVWVAKGTYYPTSGTDRSISITLVAGVHMYGGFIEGDNDLSDRIDFEEDGVNQTILSGDIGVISDNTDNSYQIVDGSSMWTIADFDGFVVAGGNGNTGSSNTDGVGISLAGGVNMANCTFKDCINGKNGGGIYFSSGTFSLENTFVENCSAENGGGIYLFNAGGTLNYKSGYVESNSVTENGGGMYLGATTIFDASQVNNNTAAGLGGGLYIPSSSNTTIRYSLIANNSSVEGGGIYVSGGSGTDINNNMIVNNYASTDGAGIYFTSWGNVTLVNNTIANNDANSGFGGGLYSIDYSGIYALNNIFYGNSLAQISLGNSNNGLTIGHCYVQGGEGGIDDGGYAFTYLDGSFGATCQTGVVNFVNPTSTIGLNPSSPAYNDANWAIDDGSVCINAGTPTSATGTTYPCFYNNGGDYEVRFDATYISDIPEVCPNGLGRINGTIDIGAFEKGGLVTSSAELTQCILKVFTHNSALNVNAEINGEVSVHNLSGKLVFSENVTAGNTTVFTPKSSGVYIVTMQNVDESYSTKVMVQ